VNEGGRLWEGHCGIEGRRNRRDRAEGGVEKVARQDECGMEYVGWWRLDRPVEKGRCLRPEV
jgi:hypothetical protein